MTDEVMLHVGCGSTYKPGFINVDMYDRRLADVIGDAGKLPFKTKSIDCIEAFHVLEHFDYVSCKYVLSEWYGLLRNGGTLALETPDLPNTLKKLVRSDVSTQARTLQWIYGVDSPGMAHKTGFSFELARSLLEECGFHRVRQRDAETHLYEPGMRLECAKPDDGDARADFISAFRSNLRRELSDFDSYLMLPLEKHLQRILTDLPPSGMLSRDGMAKALSKAVVVNPRIALAAARTIRTTHGNDNQDLGSIEATLKLLADQQVHKKAFALWCRGCRKPPIVAEFEEFITAIESEIAAQLQQGSELAENLSYLMSLDPEEISILDLDIILLKANANLNRGIREFSRGEIRTARRWLELATSTNPGDPIALWNLARLELTDGRRLDEATARYDEAIGLTSDRELKRRMSNEVELVRNGLAEKVPNGPVSE
jgi:predicted SAM-dependent methyltransferase